MIMVWTENMTFLTSLDICLHTLLWPSFILLLLASFLSFSGVISLSSLLMVSIYPTALLSHTWHVSRLMLASLPLNTYYPLVIHFMKMNHYIYCWLFLSTTPLGSSIATLLSNATNCVISQITKDKKMAGRYYSLTKLDLKLQ